jgi:hypothetical protein
MSLFFGVFWRSQPNFSASLETWLAICVAGTFFNSDVYPVLMEAHMAENFQVERSSSFSSKASDGSSTQASSFSVMPNSGMSSMSTDSGRAFSQRSSFADTAGSGRQISTQFAGRVNPSFKSFVSNDNTSQYRFNNANYQFSAPKTDLYGNKRLELSSYRRFTSSGLWGN